MDKKILITGGAGYVGSHLCVALHDAGYEPIIIDNFSNSYKDTLYKIEKIIGLKIVSIEGDIRDYNLLDSLFSKYNISAVIHCAALKSVNESIHKPIEYYDNNVAGSINLIKVMQKHDVQTLIFSSTTAVYGQAEKMPLTEGCIRAALNPYGHSKIMMEDIFMDLEHVPNKNWKIGILRYFNPVGSHDSYLIGENPLQAPSNIMPNIIKAASGELETFSVYGNDYDTKDGTCIRDYIHIMDLVDGHIEVLKYLENKSEKELYIANLGTGKDTSVLELIKIFSKVNNVDVPYKISPRREGDIAINYADPSYALNSLNWQPKKTVEDMCRSAWAFNNV